VRCDLPVLGKVPVYLKFKVEFVIIGFVFSKFKRCIY